MRPELIVWISLALLLIAAEMIAPGMFLLWLGLAAATVFVILLVVPGLAPVWQAVVFVVLAFFFLGIYVKFFRGRGKPSDQPLLNRRGEQLVGQVHALESAIENGRGRLKIGDAFWAVAGPELPVGARVRIIGVESMLLRVEAA